MRLDVTIMQQSLDMSKHGSKQEQDNGKACGNNRRQQVATLCEKDSLCIGNTSLRSSSRRAQLLASLSSRLMRDDSVYQRCNLRVRRADIQVSLFDQKRPMSGATNEDETAAHRTESQLKQLQSSVTKSDLRYEPDMVKLKTKPLAKARPVRWLQNETSRTLISAAVLLSALLAQTYASAILISPAGKFSGPHRCFYDQISKFNVTC